MNENDMSGMRLGFVLFEKEEFDWDNFIKNLYNDWQLTAQKHPEKNVLVFEFDSMIVACGFMLGPVGNNEAIENAKNNFLWPQAVEQAQKHRTHLVISVMKGEDKIKQSIIYTKVATSALKLEGALGIYQWPTVFSPNNYIQIAQIIHHDELPIMNWVYFGLYPDEDCFSGYTMGLDHFGKKEIEVIKTKNSPEKLYDFLINISTYVIEEDAELLDGETIGFSEEEKLPIIHSPGVSVQGESIKIIF